MEAAGAAAGRGGGGAGPTGAGADRLRQGQQRRGRAGRRPPSAGNWGSRSRRSDLWSDDGPADLDAWLAGSGAVVDAIFGTGFSGAPREPAAGGDRGDQPLRGAGGGLRHRLRGRRLQRRDRGSGGRGRPDRELPRGQAGAADRAREVAHAASCGWCRSGSPPERRASRPPATIDPGGAGAGAAPRARARPSSAPARWRSPAARAVSPGRCGCPRWRRSGPAPATRRSPFRPSSSRSSKRASPR